MVINWDILYFFKPGALHGEKNKTKKKTKKKKPKKNLKKPTKDTALNI